MLHARIDVIVGALRRPAQVIECSSLVATRGMLLKSERAALLSARQLEVDIDAGLLAIAAASLPGTGRDIGITTRTEWHPARIQARVLEWLERVSQREGPRH